MPEAATTSPFAFPRITVGLIARVALGFALGLAILAVAVWAMKIDRHALLTAIRNTQPWALAFSVGASFVGFAVHALRMRTVWHPSLALRFGEAYRLTIVMFLLNGILPARGGEMVGVHYVGTRTGVPRARLVGAVLLDHWMDLCGALPLVLALPMLGLAPSWVLRGGAVIAGFAALIGALMLGARWLRPRDDSWTRRVLANIRAAYVGMSVGRVLFIALLIAPLPWLAEALTLMVFLRGFAIHLGFAMAFSVLIAFKVAMVVPSPAGIGSVEVAGAGGLVLIGVAPATALASMLVFHAAQLAVGYIAGVVVLAARGTEVVSRRAAPAAESTSVLG